MRQSLLEQKISKDLIKIRKKVTRAILRVHNIPECIQSSVTTNSSGSDPM